MLFAIVPVAAGEAEPYLSAGFGITGGADGTFDGFVGGDVGITGVVRIGGDITPSFSLYALGSINAVAAPWEYSSYYGAMADVGIGIGGVARWGLTALHFGLQGIAGMSTDDVNTETGYPSMYFGGRLTIEPELMIAPAREWFGFGLSFPVSLSATTAGWSVTGGILLSFSLGDHLEGY